MNKNERKVKEWGGMDEKERERKENLPQDLSFFFFHFTQETEKGI